MTDYCYFYGIIIDSGVCRGLLYIWNIPISMADIVFSKVKEITTGTCGWVVMSSEGIATVFTILREGIPTSVES